MKILPTLPTALAPLMAIPLLLVGCGTVPLRDASRLSAAGEAYDCIKVDMTEEKATQILGSPTTTEGNQISWSTRFNPANYESLEATVDESGRIEKLVRTHARRSGEAFEHMETETFSRSYYE